MSVLGTGVIKTNWSQGLIGAVNTTGSASAGPIITQLNIGGTLTKLSSDARIIGFKWGSDHYALVSSYAYNPPAVPGSAHIAFFKYDTSLSTPAWVQQVEKSSATWGFSNPYALIVVEDDMYVLDYDSGKITKVDLTDNSTTVIYTAPNKIVGSTTYLPHGSAMDIDTGENALLAVFSYLPSSAYQPYAPSTAAYIPLPGSSAAAASNTDLNANAVAVTIDSAGTQAFVSSIGGPQVSGGNANSKVETLTLSTMALGTTPAVPGATVFNAGDFLDAVPYNDDWYLLQAYWYDVSPNPYVGYYYRVTKTTAAKVAHGTAGNSADTVNTGTVNVKPAEATWLLAPAVDALWFVNGVAANTLTIGSTSITLDQKATPGQLAGDTANYGHINTASVIIDVPDAAAAPGATPLKAAVGRAISRTKVAFRYAPVKEEEEKEEK